MRIERRKKNEREEKVKEWGMRKRGWKRRGENEKVKKMRRKK